MNISHWVDAEHRDAYWRAYDSALDLWPIPRSSLYVETPYGTTHVIVSGAAAGAPIVLVHAASLSATQWYLQAADLGAHCRLYAVDIMGDIGRSTQTGPMQARIDAANWLAAVLEGLALSSAHLIGASFGGFLSANLAVLQPHRVRSLVLLAPAATLQPFALMAKLFIRLGSLVPLPSTVRPGLRAMMCGGLPDERLVRQMEVGVAGFRYDHDGIFPSEIPDEELRAMRCPTLILVGDQERIYAPESAVSRAAKQIPHAACEVLHGLGHLLGMQDPPAVNSRITGFLAQIDAVLRH